MIDAGEKTPASVPPEGNPTPTPALPPAEPFWAKPAISVFALGIFVLAFLVAYLAKDSQSLLLMSGAAIGMAQQVVGYWVGSSSGSTAKSAQIAQAPKLMPPAPEK